MPRAPIALSLPVALALVASGCGRNAGLPPRSDNMGTPEASRAVEDQDINPRSDPERFPAMETREAN